MTNTDWAILIPAIVSCLAALTSFLRSEVAVHRADQAVSAVVKNGIALLVHEDGRMHPSNEAKEWFSKGFQRAVSDLKGDVKQICQCRGHDKENHYTDGTLIQHANGVDPIEHHSDGTDFDDCSHA